MLPGAVGLPVGRAPNRRCASRITTPKEQLGANIGDDYFLANYTQIEAYWKKLDARIRSDVARGHRQDGRRPDAVDGDRHGAREPRRARSLQGHLAAPARTPTVDRRCRRARLPPKGKAIVWIDGGLHANEVLGTQQLIETRLPARQPQRRRDAAHPSRRHRPAGQRQSRRERADGELVHARARTRRSGRSTGLPRSYQKLHAATTTTATSTCRRRPRRST